MASLRLTELSPEWIKYKGAPDVGIRFLCPHCRATNIAILFLNPPSGGKSVPKGSEAPGENWGNRWARSGMTFEDMTLSPSINAAKHWHGFVLHGEVK